MNLDSSSRCPPSLEPDIIELYKLIRKFHANPNAKQEQEENEAIRSAICSILERVSQKPDDLDYLINKWHQKDNFDTIVLRAVIEDKLEILKLILQYCPNADLNQMHPKSKLYPILMASINNNTEMIRILLNHGCDPNKMSANGSTAMLFASNHNNVEMMDILLSKNNKYSFDWDNLINSQTNDMGYNAFILACQSGCEQVVKYLISKENEYKTKIDPLRKQANGWNGCVCLFVLFLFLSFLLFVELYAAVADCNELQILEYLVQNVYEPLFKAGKYDINECDWRHRTILWMACHKGSLEIVKLLIDTFGSKLDANIASGPKLGKSVPLMRAIVYDSHECVEYLLNKTNCNINATDANNETALMKCIDHGSYQSLKILCNNKEAKITEIRNNLHAIDAVDKAAFFGEIQQFQLLILTLFERLNIDNWKAFEESKIISLEKIDKWKKWGKNNQNDGFLSFVMNIEKILTDNKQNFGLLYSTLDSIDTSGITSNMSNLQEFSKDDKIARYLLQNCDKSSLANICNVINNGLLTQECGFNDSLLFLAHKFDNKQFTNTMKQCARICLCEDKANKNESKNAKTVHFFKNNLANSKVWSLPAYLDNTIDINEISDEKSFETDTKSTSKTTLFDITKVEVIEKELLKQKQYLQQQIIKQEKEFGKNWNDLKYSILYRNIGTDHKLSQNRIKVDATVPKIGKQELMGDEHVSVDYKRRELPFDNVNAFNGEQEYDLYGYLTKLLIAAHKIDPIFQSTCKRLFEMDQFGSCTYTAAPPKTKERCKMKTLLEYYDAPWPRSAQLLDLVRGSIVFETSKDLLRGFELFRRWINSERFTKDSCLKYIVRVKNGFNCIKDESWNLDIKEFDYCDIKINVLIEYNGMKLIGELQFMLDFMLKAKKMSHRLYSFVRNESYFQSLERMNSQSKGKLLKKIILNQNVKFFSNFLDDCNDDDKKMLLDNKDSYNQLFQDTQWQKGAELFELACKYWTDE